MPDWVTYDEALQLHDMTPQMLRRLVVEGHVRTRRGNRVQKFFEPDILSLKWGSPLLLETTAAVETEMMLSDPWLTYSELWQEHKVKRGHLDAWVHRGLVHTRRENGRELYSWEDLSKLLDIDPLLADDPLRGRL